MRANTRGTRLVTGSVVGILASAVWLVGGVSSADPPGNNGTVKVAGVDLDGGGNDSHVGCSFTVEFFGYDAGDLYADLTIDGHPPTGGGLLWMDRVFIGADAAGGGTDLDASAPVDLSARFVGGPHEQQGFHVKLTVHADGSTGADTKYKTFWVDCSSGEEGGEEDTSET